MSRSSDRRARREDRAAVAMAQGWAAVREHPLFAPMIYWRSPPPRDDVGLVAPDGWAVLDTRGGIHAHPTRLGEPEVWHWVFAHLLLHLGLGHLDPARSGGTRLDVAHIAACDVAVNRFLAALKPGRPPDALPVHLPGQDELALGRAWRSGAVPPELTRCGVGGQRPDIVALEPDPRRYATDHDPPDWEALFAAGLTAAVTAAVDVAGGAREHLTADSGPLRPWEAARRWFIAEYPLLGALFSTLTVVADAELARHQDITVAAVSPAAGEIYVNPHHECTAGEWRFVLAHEALHAALAHQDRVGGRDPYLWNLACDFVVNGWLVEMGVGEMLSGALYDPAFAGSSAESVYDRISTEARRYRRLATLRRHGDMIGDLARPVGPVTGVDLDELLRRGLSTGLDLHARLGRGTLPASLVAEIRARDHPPLTWDVELARWFDEHFPAVERRRSYARPSRRQAGNPDIPMPGYHRPQDTVVQRTFGVVLDTSGSMNAELLGKGLGAIASYAASRDVPAARVVFCDAAAYDAGYLAVDEIAGRVRVRGRGGTVLQPGVDLLERAPDFPADGPILVITDGFCDVVRIRRTHAFLIPAGASLPFTPRGPLFRLT